jgi:putative addiction module component (TIGR02574 family)
MGTFTARDVAHLSVEERLELVHDIWDTIRVDAHKDPSCLPIPRAVLEEARRRIEEVHQDPSKGIPLDDVLDQLDRLAR